MSHFKDSSFRFAHSEWHNSALFQQSRTFHLSYFSPLHAKKHLSKKHFIWYIFHCFLYNTSPNSRNLFFFIILEFIWIKIFVPSSIRICLFSNIRNYSFFCTPFKILGFIVAFIRLNIDEILSRDDLYESKRDQFIKKLSQFRERYDV